MESKYLILLQEVKTPVCSEEPGPARGVIAQLLEDALQADGPEQPGQALVKPRLVRWGHRRLRGGWVGGAPSRGWTRACVPLLLRDRHHPPLERVISTFLP